MIIKPKWSAGDRIDFVPRPGNQHGLGGAKGSIALPEHHVLSSMQKAIQEGQGVRKRAVIDRVIDDNTVRLMLDETLELVWASLDEIEPLDSISSLGDLVGPASRSLKDGLREMEKAAEEAAPAPAKFAVDERVGGYLDREWAVTRCYYNPLEGRESWEYHLVDKDGFTQHQVPECLLVLL